MLRQVLLKATTRSTCIPAVQISARNLVTSAKKRALNKQQLGKDAPAPKPAQAPKPVKATEPPASGSSVAPLVIGAVVIGGAAAAYYTDSIPKEALDTLGLRANGDTKEVVEKAAPVVAETKDEATAPKQEAPAKKEDETDPNETDPNKVSQITTFGGQATAASAVAAVQHPANGNRVVMAPASKQPAPYKPSTDAALMELKRDLAERQNQVLGQAHEELAKVSAIPLEDLDDLSVTQLKIRLVQLSKELQERTQWEAVRLKEFLAMKEKETSDRYTQLMKKQRMEMEDTMERRLKTQKMDMTQEMQGALYRKEQALQTIVDHALKLQEQEYFEEKAQFEKDTAEQLSFKMEQQYGQSLAQAKDEIAQKLAVKVQQMEQLVDRVQNLESALKASKQFQQGSLQAHHMSAAALALIERLESSEPAAKEIATLVATTITAPNSVIESAIRLLPDTVRTAGVPSLSELQTQFEESVHTKARQATMVPKGNVGLEGQLLGMAFATLKVAPGPDDAAPAEQTASTRSEYALSRARRQIQLGNLEKAVEQLDGLEKGGQAAFTVQDWKESAKQRIAVDKALKMIRLECALANATLAKDAPKD